MVMLGTPSFCHTQGLLMNFPVEKELFVITLKCNMSGIFKCTSIVLMSVCVCIQLRHLAQ